MSTTTKVLGFLAALVVVFAAALGVGNLVGPVGSSAATHDAMSGEPKDDEMAADTSSTAADSADIPGGLMVTQNGYSLDLVRAPATPGAARRLSFTIDGPDGEAVTRFDLEQEKALHLIVVRRDFAGYQHVHPTMRADGLWSTALDLEPGVWRVFADFKPTGGEDLTLGTDLAVAGDYRPEAGAALSRSSSVNGYTVSLDGDLVAGTDAKLTLTVTKDGSPVTELEPYLGAYGHLVALRGGDLAYLHVHPEGAPDDGATKAGPEVVFYADVPTRGAYHLYLDFKHQGVVRTAAFTLAARTPPAPSQPASPSEPSPSDDHGDDESGH